LAIEDEVVTLTSTIAPAAYAFDNSFPFLSYLGGSLSKDIFQTWSRK
jgi:hypothetical protein